MRTSELLKDCKIKLKITSDYALAKALEIPTQRISEYMKEKKKLDAYAIVKIAECLKLNPLKLLAEVEEENAKRKEEKNFWADFQQRVTPPLKGFMLALLCTLSLLTGFEQAKNPAGIFRRKIHA